MAGGLGFSEGLTGQASSLFLGKQKTGASAFSPIQQTLIDTPGFAFSSAPRAGDTRTLQTTLTPQDTAARLALERRFPMFLEDIAGLREDVRPNFSLFRRAGLGQLANERDRTIGNLRESLARRGVFGSSFAADALSRTGAEFGQRRAEFEAQVGLQEAGATQALIGFENQLIMQQILREFQEFTLAAGLGQQFQALFNQSQALLAQITQQDEAIELQRGEFTRQLTKDIAGSVAGGISGGASSGFSGFGG